MNKASFLFLIMVLLLVTTAGAQTRSRLGEVCGDPSAACRTRENFQVYELPFEFGKNYVMAESKPFYSVILKSVKLNPARSNCESVIPEGDRIAAQALFPRNKVFVMRCFDAGGNYYTNTSAEASFMAVFAGRTLAEANRFLKTVKSTGQFDGAFIRRMRIGINGT